VSRGEPARATTARGPAKPLIEIAVVEIRNQGGATIARLPPRRRVRRGSITGLFFCFPREWRERRRAAMIASGLPANLVAAICDEGGEP
jgi:hypothetical protein